MRSLVVAFLVALLTTQISAQCDYTQALTPGASYTISSPGYPAYYTSGLSCSWLATAPPGYKVVLTCSNVVIPCNLDTFTINVYGQWSGNGDVPQCGSGTTTIESLTNALSVRLRTTTNQGRFTCTIKTAVDPCQCGRRLVRSSTSIPGYPLM